MSRFVLIFGLCLLLAACASRPPPATTLPLPPPSGEPAKLIGVSASNLRGFFGAPSFVRKENGAEMWRYDGTNCRAFFFLYPQSDSQIVRHVETVPHKAGSAADANCLDALRGRRPAS